MAKRKFTDEQVEEMQGMIDGGLTQGGVAKAMDCGIKTVQRYLVPGARDRDYRSNQTYHDAHTEEIKAYQAQYGRDNRETMNERALAWNKAHPEARKRAVRRDYEKHKARFEAASALRRAMVIGATIGNLAEIAEIYRQAREDAPIRCYLCGKLIPLGEGERHVDHVIPLKPDDPTVTPGKHCPSNLRITHATCNWKKNNFMVDTLDWVILGT